MKTCYTNERYFAYVLSHSADKIRIFENTAARVEAFNGYSLGLSVDVMEHGIIRFNVSGCRSSMTVCWDINKHEVIRQPRGLKVSELQGKASITKDIDIYPDEILRMVEENINLRAAAEAAEAIMEEVA